jgi:hypothetical protein
VREIGEVVGWKYFLKGQCPEMIEMRLALKFTNPFFRLKITLGESYGLSTTVSEQKTQESWILLKSLDSNLDAYGGMSQFKSESELQIRIKLDPDFVKYIMILEIDSYGSLLCIP